MLTQDRLKELMFYIPENGNFYWNIDSGYRKVNVGDKAGSFGPKGYWQLKIDCRTYRAHRVAFLYMLGRWPLDQVDHKNRIRHDNRWENLREVNNSQNQRNAKQRISKTGIRGVREYNGKFIAYIRDNNQQIYLGYYNNIDDAKIAVQKANGDVIKLNDYTFASEYISGAMAQ